MTGIVSEVDASYFRKKYPGLPPDAIVQARVELAARYAGIEGGLSAGAYTGAVAATIGSGGGASPLTLPAAGATFAVDLAFTTQLQLRLVHDISVLYGVPLDLTDPEDLWRLIRIAFSVKGGETGGAALGKGVPMVVRVAVKKIFSGARLGAVKSLPVVGKHLLQRNIIKFSIPLVGVPVSIAVNFWTTKVVGAQATRAFRTEARIREAARRIAGRTTHPAELLWVLWLLITADRVIHQNERSLLKHVVAEVDLLDRDLPALSDLSDTVELEEDKVWAMLASATGDMSSLYDAGVLAAVVDGRVLAKKLAHLERLAQFCSTVFDEKAVKESARSWS